MIYQTSADITFTRPSTLSVSGTGMMNTAYQLTSDGTTTNVTINGKPFPVKSVEDGVASVTGLGESAPTTIPAALLHTKWGYPFTPGRTVSNAVITQDVNGKPCYMVVVLTPIRQAFWIDKQTYLLAQVATKIDMGSMGSMHQLQTITNSVATPTAGAAVTAPPTN
jgi:hypothetical protein